MVINLSRSCENKHLSICAGVLGLDNLDYAASVLDKARSQGQSRARTSTGGGSTLNNLGRDRIVNTSGSDGEAAGRQRSPIMGRTSLRRQGGMATAAKLTGPRRGGQAAFGRLGLSVSPQDLRRMMDIINAGRRR